MIKIIAFGHFKNNNLKPIYQEYEKRIKRYLKIELIELKELPIKKTQNIKTILLREEKIILDYLKKTQNVYLLSEHGKTFDSLLFKKKIYSHIDNSQNIIFVLGSAHGFSPSMLKKYPKISLSEMTFPHLLARIMLIEQIYRAVTINHNIKYHK